MRSIFEPLAHFSSCVVLSKCKHHLEEGARLENLVWRQWYQVRTQPPLSAAPYHEVPQTKNETPQDDWSSKEPTPPLSQDDLYYEEEELLYDDDEDDAFYDDDDEDYYDDDFYDDEEEEDQFMHRPYFQKKVLPPRIIQRPSLLSALFKTPPSSISHTHTAPDHFLTKEWSESLRDNVLWEHVQQKPFCSPPKKPEHHQAWLESFHGW